MKRNTRKPTQPVGTAKRRTVLCVDPDESYASMLDAAWRQLQLADNLHIVRSQEEALQFFDSAEENGDQPAAVILDPDVTGEATGAFMREVRKHCGKTKIPVVFWSQHSEQYKVLEGLGVDSVLKKPMVLRLVQSLDEVCDLGVQNFKPYAGDHAIENPVLPLTFGETQ